MRILKITMIILFAHYVTVNAQTVNQKNDSGEKIGSWVKYHDNGKKSMKVSFITIGPMVNLHTTIQMET